MRWRSEPIGMGSDPHRRVPRRGPAAAASILAIAVAASFATPCAAQSAAQPAGPPPGQPAAQPACPAPGLRIGRITIDRRPVFETAPGDTSLNARLGAVANPLHVRTREHVIREELLFREGDECRDEDLAQSERNLRARRLFQTVTITATLGDAGLADVRVATQDAWTLRVSGDLARIGGALAWEVGLADTSVAGEGFGVGILHREEIGARVGSAWAGHDRLFGTRERLTLSIDERSDGDAWAAGLARPFFAIDSRWAHDLSAGRLRDRWRLYDEGEVTDEYARDSTGVAVRLARRIGPVRDARVWRVGAGYRFGAMEFARLDAEGTASDPAAMPPSHRFAGPFATVQFLEHRFVKRRGLIVPGRDLDVNLGWQFSASAWVSIPTASLETEARTMTSASLTRGWAPGTGIVTASAGLIVRAGGADPPDADATGGLRAWWPHSAMHVTAIAIDVRALVNPEPGYRLYLGGSAGLAGFREYVTFGTRTASVQVEERRYFPWKPAGLVQVGVAVFAGAGVLGGRRSASLASPFLADVGFGLRVAHLTSSANSAARIDVAFPLTTPADGARRPLLVVGYQRSF